MDEDSQVFVQTVIRSGCHQRWLFWWCQAKKNQQSQQKTQLAWLQQQVTKRISEQNIRILQEYFESELYYYCKYHVSCCNSALVHHQLPLPMREAAVLCCSPWRVTHHSFLDHKRLRWAAPSPPTLCLTLPGVTPCPHCPTWHSPVQPSPTSHVALRKQVGPESWDCFICFQQYFDTNIK